MRKNAIVRFATIAIILSLSFYVSGCSDSRNTTIREQYQYDSKGKLVCKIAPDGSTTNFKYNNKGFLIEIKYPKGEWVRYDYDVSGNRILTKNPLGKTKYKYDAFNRLIEVTFKYSPERKIKYEYDPWHRVSKIKILQDSKLIYQVKYDYNITGNLRSIDDGYGQIKYNYYPKKNQVVRQLPNKIKTVFSYSSLGELTSLKHLNQHNELIISYHYEYDSPGKISRVVEKSPKNTRVTRYEWDNRGYLKTLHLPDSNTIQYEYDSMGNRVSMTDSRGSISYKYDNFGRLIKAGNNKYKWNKNGNLTKWSKTRIRYDGRGLPSLARTPDATIRYGWDGNGNMISRRVGKELTHHLSNPLAPSEFTLAEFDKTNRLTTSYLYGNVLLGQRGINGNMKYFLEDGFNSIGCSFSLLPFDLIEIIG